MSALTGVSSASSSELIQRLGQSRPPGAPEPGQTPPGFDETLQSTAEAAGLDATQIAELRSEIESAIEQAISESDDPGSFREAVAEVLEANGIDAEAFHTQLRETFGGPPPGGPPPSASGEAGGSDIQSLLEALDTGDEDSEDASSVTSLLSLLRNLPSGSLVNTAA